MWKKFLGGFVLFIVLLFMLVMYATSGITDTADKFFSAIGMKNYDRAYAMLSEDFKQNVSKEQFKAFMEKNGYTLYDSSNWGNRSVDGNHGELEGSIQTLNGSAIPVKLKLIKDANGNWKIYAINKPSSGIITENSNKNSTNEKLDYEQMVKDTMHTFALSVNEKSMSRIYKQMSNIFKEQISLEKMNQLFKDFIDKNIDLTKVDNLKPVFEKKPFINSDGVLVLQGYYNTEPKLRFTFKYYKENNQWKPLGIRIYLKN
jgi:hypothetical protein